MDSNKKEIKDALEEIEKGIENLLTSDSYKEYLNFVSSFYNYSSNNVLLILSQMSYATHVGSYGFWKKKNRYVKKGEHGIKIIAPNIKKVPQETESKQTKENKNNPNISNSTEEKLILTGFHYTTVFDISQTDGEEVPSILSKLNGYLPISDIIIETIEDISILPINYRELDYNGYCSDVEIAINKNLSPNQTAKTLIHEYLHSIFHNDINDYSANRSKYEIQAESTAYVVSKHFGLDTSDYSFGYIASWKKIKSMEEIRETLNTISNISELIITKMEDSIQNTYENIIKEEKEKIVYDLKRNNISPTKDIIDKFLQLNDLTKKTYSIKDIQQSQKNLSTFSSEEQALIKSISVTLQEQQLIPTLANSSIPTLEI